MTMYWAVVLGLSIVGFAFVGGLWLAVRDTEKEINRLLGDPPERGRGG